MRRLSIVILASLAAASVAAAPKGRKTTKTTKKVDPKKGSDAKGSDATAAGSGSAAATTTPTTGTTPPAGTGMAGTGTGTPGTGGGSGATGTGGGTSGGAGTPTPTPTTTTTSDPAPAPAGPDVDALRQEYLALRDELFKSRARANTVASQLYSTKIQIKLTYTSGRFYNPAKSSIRLDGASVYDNASGAIANDDGIRFEGYVAPGKHVLTFRVEATGKDDDSFASTTEAQIVVKAVANKDLIVTAKARDAGDIAYNWKREERGSYGLAIDVGVSTAAPAVGGKK